MFFHYCTCFWPPWTPWVQHQRHQSGLLSPKHNVSNLACKSRTFKAHYTWYSMEKIVSAMEENFNRENTMKAWKNHTIEDIIFVIENVMKATQPKTINSCWKKCVQLLCMTSQDLLQSQTRESWKKIMDMGEKDEGERFWDMALEVNRHHTRELQRTAWWRWVFLNQYQTTRKKS